MTVCDTHVENSKQNPSQTVPCMILTARLTDVQLQLVLSSAALDLLMLA